MLRSLAAFFGLLTVFAAHAVEQTEPPVESNTTGIVVFFVLAIGCFALYLWYTWKAEKKSEDEKLGDKF
jgi:hypothetical protein